MGLKVLIVTVWLALPVAALFLLRGDYDRYQSETEVQLRHAQALSEHIALFSSRYEDRMLEVLNIRDLYSRQQWERRLDDVRRQQLYAEERLGQSSLNHFTYGGEALREAQRLLEEQRLHIREAARLRDAYIKVESGTDDLANEAFRLRGWADYYRRIGAWEPYLHVQEALGRVEDQLRQRQARKYELGNSLSNTMIQAEGYERDLQRTLARLPAELERDQQTTYREHLTQRFARFDLRAELRRVWANTAWAQNP